MHMCKANTLCCKLSVTVINLHISVKMGGTEVFIDDINYHKEALLAS